MMTVLQPLGKLLEGKGSILLMIYGILAAQLTAVQPTVMLATADITQQR